MAFWICMGAGADGDLVPPWRGAAQEAVRRWCGGGPQANGGCAGVAESCCTVLYVVVSYCTGLTSCESCDRMDALDGRAS